MNLNHQIHHDEQMEAHRRDFHAYWNQTRQSLKLQGYTDRAMVMEDMRQWRMWMEMSTDRRRECLEVVARIASLKQDNSPFA